MDFEAEIDAILKVVPRERVTALFSATMTSKVAKLQRACLRDPVRVEACAKYATVDTLRQQYAFVPAKHKDAHVVAALTDLAGAAAIIFTRTCDGARRLALTLRALGFGALPIHGQMSQPKRLAALAAFKAGDRPILVATDVAARGLDIPSVDLVLNYDVPINSKDYVHRVGRTARAGRSGRAVTFVTQYDVEPFQRIEAATGVRMEAWPVDADAAALLLERVGEAQRVATAQMRDADRKRGGKRGAPADDNDADDLLGGRRAFKKKY
jgi:ATP-dependent RNA helicase DDX47/RRP3